MPIADLAGFVSELRASVASGTFVRAALGKAASELFPERALVAPAAAKGEPRLQIVERFRTRDNTLSLPPEEALAKISSWLGKRFLSATVFTSEGEFSMDHNRRGEARFSSSRRAPAPKAEAAPKNAAGLDMSWPWLRSLGLLNGEGKIAKGMERKWRQVEKFLETFDALSREAGLADLPEIRVTDMGSGMGYLTFALHAHLERTMPGKARTLGVEARPDLVRSCNAAARECGMSGLRFEEGRIGDRDRGAMDVLVALHACDAATDDALFSAVRGGAKLILSVPCCHKQLRPQLKCEGGWGEALGWGILAERQAEMVTDALRAMLLSAEGYRANVAEFVSAEHTAKNVLVTGVLKGPNPRRAEILREVAEIKARFGIREHRLETLLRA